MREERQVGSREPFDPVALTLALWLGLVAGVGGLSRLSENAAAQAASAHRSDLLADDEVPSAADARSPLSPWMLAFGG